MIQQFEFSFPIKRRGFHLITQEVLQQIGDLPDVGLFNLFVQHTSCGLSINENADPSVRVDFESMTNMLVPEDEPYLTHTLEGSDDMPAHVKSSLYGQSITIPITNGKLNLGTWQGIYFCEFRDYGGSRRFVATIYG